MGDLEKPFEALDREAFTVQQGISRAQAHWALSEAVRLIHADEAAKPLPKTS